MTKIICDDILVPVGKEARIKATLAFGRTLRLRCRLKERTITFLVDGEKIGDATTGPDGSASVTFIPREGKEYHLVVLSDTPSRPRSTARATIFSRSTSKQAIVLDLDGTLSVSSTFRAVFRKNRAIAPVADSVAATKALAEKYDFLVVTGRKTYLSRKTRRWLAEKGFPPMPIFFSPITVIPIRLERLKTRLIRQLKQTWPNISIAIGDKDADARAYLANGLKPIILRQKGPSLPGAIALPDWRSIQRMLLE